MANEKFTQLPTVASAQLSDIICAVQAGISSQETLQQIVNLGLTQTILNFAGNPNGSVAGATYQLCFDTTNSVLYVCTTTGSTTTAVWTSIVPKTTRILDSNNITVFGLSGTASAVNYLQAANNITGNGPALSAQGTDTNISLNISPKGTGSVGLVTSALTQPVFIYSGTSNQHTTRFQMSNTAADRTVTFQDAAGTLAYLSDIPAGSASALTRTNDTNVTLTLGGTPATALLQATSITAGWAGTLSGARGGTGVANTGLTITLASGATGYLLTSDSSGNATWAAPGYLTGAVLLSPSGNQSILSNNLTLAAGTMTIGATGGGVNGALVLYPNSASAGGFRLLNNTVSSFTTTLSNSSVGQGTTLSLPDPGSATANVLLTNSGSNITLNYGLTLSSVNFGGSTLSTYTDSTFTPTMTCGTPGNLSVAYANQTGIYVRIGSMVYANVRIQFTPTFTTASGTVQIAGLPFAVQVGNGIGWSGSVSFFSGSPTFPVTTTCISVQAESGASFCTLPCLGSAVPGSSLQMSGLATGVQYHLVFSVAYHV